MVTAIILAGGKGKRMKSDKSKQFIDLNGKPILYYTIKNFIEHQSIDKVILVISKDEEEFCKKNVLEKFNIEVDDIAYGGKERQDSVYNGLKKAEGSDIVLIHDGARPFVSNEMIDNSIKYARLYEAAAPGVMPKDTIKVRSNDGFSKETLNRNKLVAVQTPQSFKFDLIYESHKRIAEEKIRVTDDTMVVECFGKKVYLFDGEYTNIKITTPEDMVLAEHLVKE